MMLLSIFSIAGCASVERPSTMAWWLNGPASRLEGYNIKSDYDDNGTRLPGAKLKTRAVGGLKDLNGALVILATKPHDPDEGQAGLKAWLSNERDWVKEHCR